MKKNTILIFLPLLLAACSDADPQQIKEKLLGGQAEERVITVGVQRIDTVDGLVRNSYPGALEESHSVDISFKYGGTLQQLNVAEGSHVRKGQVLARVSSPSMESSLHAAQATLEQAQDAYDRLKKVHDNGSLPEIKWQEMVANLEKAQANYDLANAMMADNTVTAPFEGTVTDLNATVGESITPLKPILRVIGSDDLVVKISVPENEISLVKVGDEAQILIPALDDRRYEGTVIEKSMTASLLTHSYPVKVSISQPDAELLPGMVGKVVLQGDVNKGIIVPATAVLINNEGHFVWVVNEGRATRRKVSIGGYSGSGIVIGEGLKPNDIVIVEGYQKVSEGMRVSYE